MPPLDAEIDCVEQRLLHGPVREQRERVRRHGAVVAGALDGVLQRPVPAHDADGALQIALGDLARLERPCQKARSSAVPRRKDSTTGRVILPSRKSSPTFLPSSRRVAAIVERVVDELEGDAEIHAVAAAGGLLGLGAPARTGPTSQAAANNSAVLPG